MAEEEENNEEEAPAGSDPEPDATPEPDANEGSDPSSDADPAPAGSDPEAEATPEPDASKGSDPSSGDGEAPAPAPARAAKAPADDEEKPEVVTQKAKRKLERSQHEGEARPNRSIEERAADRAAVRKQAAGNRRRYRARAKAKPGEPGQGTPAAEREPGPKKVRQGQVVSAKADKTITVRIDVARRHPQYEKVVRRSSTLHAHDADNQAQEGDTVRVIETRPLSRTKRWRLVEVVEKAR
jgi:small subunit ribosomal protein S17